MNKRNKKVIVCVLVGMTVGFITRSILVTHGAVLTCSLLVLTAGVVYSIALNQNRNSSLTAWVKRIVTDVSDLVDEVEQNIERRAAATAEGTPTGADRAEATCGYCGNDFASMAYAADCSACGRAVCAECIGQFATNEVDALCSKCMASAKEEVRTLQNQLWVIYPYKPMPGGVWMFDDDRVGLKREPFVGTTNDVIDSLLTGWDANLSPTEGFVLTFSDEPFPDYDLRCTRVDRDFEGTGTYYQTEDGSMTGWLCPALKHYYPVPPDNLYVKASPAAGRQPSTPVFTPDTNTLLPAV